MKTAFLLVFLIVNIFVQPALAADTNSVAELQQQVQKLKAENEALKQENQVLRKLAFEKQSQVQSATQPQEQRTAVGPTATAPSTLLRQPAPAPAAQKSYWMTSSSGKRHNSSCRYYGTTKGRACGPNDGVACKVCGG